jgi:hypothetical protein
VLIDPEWDLRTGDFVEVEITGAEAHDLRARPVSVDD